MSYIYLMRLCSKCFAIRIRSAVLRGEAARRLVLCELKGNLLPRTSMLSNLTDKNGEKDGNTGIVDMLCWFLGHEHSENWKIIDFFHLLPRSNASALR